MFTTIRDLEKFAMKYSLDPESMLHQKGGKHIVTFLTILI